MRQHLDRAAAAVAAAASVAATLCVAVMSAVVIYVVAARYLFGSAPAWGEELPRILLIWGGLLGAVVAARNGSHLSAGLLPMILPNARRRRGLERMAILASIFSCLVLTQASFNLVERTAANRLPALHVSVGWVYAAGIVGFAALTFVLAVLLIAPPRDPKDP